MKVNTAEKFYDETRSDSTLTAFVVSVLCTWIALILVLVSQYSEDAITDRLLENINSQTNVVHISLDNGEIQVTELNSDSSTQLLRNVHEYAASAVSGTEETAETSVEATLDEEPEMEPLTDEVTGIEEVELAAPLMAMAEEQPIEEVNTWFGGYTDIASNNGVTAEMLDACTAYFAQYQSFDNQFLDKGWVFIEAQEQSGIDALWLYAVSVYESGWGTSDLALERANYYGIGAWDTDIDQALVMGDSLYTGIVQGAIWIKKNYYDKGMTSMIAMNSTPHYSYAPGNTIWIPTISEFINEFYYNWRS